VRISKKKMMYIIVFATLITITTIIMIYLGLIIPGLYTGGVSGGTGG